MKTENWILELSATFWEHAPLILQLNGTSHPHFKKPGPAPAQSTTTTTTAFAP